MLKINNPAARGMAAATLLGALLVAGPLYAAAPAPAPGAAPAATTPAPQDVEPAAGKPSRADRVETRIKTLHDKLGITAAQEASFGAVAQAMRDNAAANAAASEKHREGKGSMTAVEELRSYQEVMETHAQGLQKLIPAFETLYASLSDGQKKTADELFAHQPGRHHKAEHHKGEHHKAAHHKAAHHKSDNTKKVE
jgi:periplasmic protein CpxP/Spy